MKMLLLSLIFLLLANAVTKRREKSILFNRVAIIILLYSSIVGYDSLAITSLGRGISIYGGLFHLTATAGSLDILVTGVVASYFLFVHYKDHHLIFESISPVKSQKAEVPDNNIFFKGVPDGVAKAHHQEENTINSLDPYYVSGFCDGESTFTISITKDKKNI